MTASTMLASDAEQQLRALPAEALLATLEQQILQLERLRSDTSEMTRLIDANSSQSAGFVVSDDDALDGDSIAELRIACHENVGVIQRKQDLVRVMCNILDSHSGRDRIEMSMSLRSRVEEALKDDTTNASPEDSVGDAGMHL